ncbi:MAG: helix-turn-helix transcriptional regulator [Phycisphaerae bacterium]
MRKSRFTPQYARFLERLRALKAKKGLLQADLAERLGVPQQCISRFENGETRLDVVQLWLYCRATGVSFTTFCRQLDKDFADASESTPGKRR